MKTQQGFTLVGWVIAVVAVIVVLAASYAEGHEAYVVRAKVAEGLALSGGAKAAVNKYYANMGRLPDSNISVGIAAPKSISGTYVSEVGVTKGGLIKVIYGGQTNSATDTEVSIELSPTAENKTDLKWTCKGAISIAPTYLPSSCRQ